MLLTELLINLLNLSEQRRVVSVLTTNFLV